VKLSENGEHVAVIVRPRGLVRRLEQYEDPPVGHDPDVKYVARSSIRLPLHERTKILAPPAPEQPVDQVGDGPGV
jgi:hypothetical protein